MRLCEGLLCDEAATIWFRGAWCGACALKRFGKRDIILAARFSELHRSLEASRSTDCVGASMPAGEKGPGNEPLSNPDPVLGEGASVGGSLPASEPPPLTDAELTDVLEWEAEWQGW